MVYVSFCYMEQFIEAIFKNKTDMEVWFSCLYLDYHIIEIYEEDYKTYNNEELISSFGKNFIFF